MRDPWNDSELVERIRAHERTAFRRAPLNSALSGAIAQDRSLHTLLAHAPADQQYPVLLLAAIHYMVLAEPAHELARWYPNLHADHRDPQDPALASILATFVNDRAPSVLDLLANRRVQTNEVGRCALFLAGFDRISPGIDPIAQIDVGTSAGLTTLLPRFGFRYDDGPALGTGTPLITCSTRGDRIAPTTIPAMAPGRGIDLDPIDIEDPDDARWLQACCWPDQTDRFERLAAAIELARLAPPNIIAGDAVDLIEPTIATVPADQHPVVTTSWALNYLNADRRGAFMRHLESAATDRDLSWVFAESPTLTPELPHDPRLADAHTTALVVVQWRGGVRTVDHVAECHPHGYWLKWL